jgi:putative transposase
MGERNEIILQNEAFEPKRERVTISIGALVQQGNIIYRIAQVLDFESVIGINVESGRSEPLRMGDLRPVSPKDDLKTTSMTDLAEIADEDWKIAEKRFAAIKPLINDLGVSRPIIEHRAKELNIDPSTLYRWMKRYKTYGVVTALIPKKRGWSEGKSRIQPESDQIIEEVIRDYYLTPQRPTVQKTIIEALRRCSERNLKVPAATTIRARIARISEKESLRGRGFREKAKNKYLPVPGFFPNADFPLAVVQIDHTPADILLVDDVYRKPIGRPWITLAMDVYSRMVTGYYLSFDPPSETSVAMCVAHMILPKDEWLLLHKVEAQWPTWGIPKTIHVDNGADFRSDTFRQSCLAYGINLEFRPVKAPRYGGHIERILGTLLREIHLLPGTTFSSIKDREGYDAEKNSAMTKSEFEEWLVTLICKIYHHRLHTGIGMTPLRKWEIGIFGNSEVHGIGIPPRPADRLTLLLDFLPSFWRTIQTFGVSIDDMTYYAEALRPWINASDPETKKKRNFVFRRDPRDISSIWFFDPIIKQYFKIPFANQSLPSMSIWEYQQVRETLKKEGAKSVNDHQVYRALTELRNIVEESKGRTKRARRQAQRRIEHEKNVTPANPISPSSPPSTLLTASSILSEEEVEVFGDIS